MNGKAIVICDIMGIYQVKIVDFDKGHRIERYDSTCSNLKAYELAEQWSKETGYPVRIQSGIQLSKIEKRRRIAR